VQPLYHTAMSPVVDGDLVIIHVGGHDEGALTAFDVATGDLRWSWDGDGPAYGSPMVFELEGTRQVVTFTQENLVGISVTTGELLWRRPYTTQRTTTSQTPILYGQTLIEAGASPEEVTADRFAEQLDTRGLPDPDLLIRTSGELRISNFLLWQIAYTEIWVTETQWPDFRRRHLFQAILDYQRRERRYGGIVEQAAATAAEEDDEDLEDEEDE